jgi:hypothetical protein
MCKCNAGFSAFLNFISLLLHRQFVFDDLTVILKFLLNELAQWQLDSVVFQNPALHLHRPVVSNGKERK